MIESELCFQAIRKALSRGGDYCDLFLEERTDTGITLDDGKVEGLTTGLSAGMGLRVIIGTTYLYMYSGNPTPEKLLELAEQMSRAVSVGQSGDLGELHSA